MDVFDAVTARKSIRSYQSKPVPEEVLMKVLESARLAPSAVNRQPWHFVVVRDAGKRKKLSAGKAPASLAANTSRSIGRTQPMRERPRYRRKQNCRRRKRIPYRRRRRPSN